MEEKYRQSYTPLKDLPYRSHWYGLKAKAALRELGLPEDIKVSHLITSDRIKRSGLYWQPKTPDPDDFSVDRRCSNSAHGIIFSLHWYHIDYVWQLLVLKRENLYNQIHIGPDMIEMLSFCLSDWEFAFSADPDLWDTLEYDVHHPKIQVAQ